MQHYDRRQFISTTLAGAGALMTLPFAGCQTTSSKPAGGIKGTDQVMLGRTGIRASRLAQGTGFNGYNRSSAHTRAGKQAFDTLVHHSLDQGITFLDMADLYGSHPFVKDVIKGLKRDKLVLLSKIWPRKETWVTPSGGAQAEVDRFRQELNTDMIDICLIHCMTNGNWAEEYKGIRDGLSELKSKKIVRAVGVSCHDIGAMKTAAAHPWVDVIFARVNYKCGADYACDAGLAEVTETLKLARTNGKTVVGMKVFGAGKLIKPEEKDASLNYVFSNKLVDAITVGMLTTEEVDDTLLRISQVGKG